MKSVFEFADRLRQNPTQGIFISLINEIEKTSTAEDIQEMQWNKGEDNQGKILGYYSYATEVITKGKKRAGDAYNLFDTGDFRKGLYLAYSLSDNFQVNFVINSTDSKTPLLINKLGNRIFGIQNNNIQIFSNKIKELLINKLNKTIP